MGQVKYIMMAILLIVVGTTIYYGSKNLLNGRCTENSLNNVDNHSADSLTLSNQPDGRRLFISKCASCHNVIKNGTGPALVGIDERGPWHDRKILYKYIRDPLSIGRNKYIDSLRKVYGFKHMAFPDLTDDEISAIFKYINDYVKPIAD